MHTKPYRFYFHLGLAAGIALFFNSLLSQAVNANPNAHYFDKGAALKPWIIALGSESNWYVPLKNGEGKTKDKQLKVVTEKDKEKGQVIRAKWSGRKGPASFAISGEPINIKTLEDKGALLITMKLNKAVKRPLALSMNCTYPCRGTTQLRPILRKYPVNEWFSLPVPLNCFSKAGTDLSKVNAPLHLQTKGKIDISLSSVTLALLPEGEKGCAK